MKGESPGLRGGSQGSVEVPEANFGGDVIHTMGTLSKSNTYGGDLSTAMRTNKLFHRSP